MTCNVHQSSVQHDIEIEQEKVNVISACSHVLLSPSIHVFQLKVNSLNTPHHMHTDTTVLSGQYCYNTPYFGVKTKPRRKTITI